MTTNDSVIDRPHRVFREVPRPERAEYVRSMKRLTIVQGRDLERAIARFVRVLLRDLGVVR